MKKQFALALYANEAESEDELTFKKNDIFQVIQFDYLGMEGWWLCKILKTNKTGLAAGNRLKIVQDEKMLLKINTLINNAKLSNYDTKSDKSGLSVGSSASSTCSVLSSNSSTSSMSCNTSPDRNISRMQTLSLQPTSSNEVAQQKDTKSKIVLPVKLNKMANQAISASKTSFLTESTENILSMKSNLTKFKTNFSPSVKSNLVVNDNDDDDYDYDIPENKPLESELQNDIDTIKSAEPSQRKSTTPTIDSGISTTSLASFGKSDRDRKSVAKSVDDSTSSTSSDDSLSSSGMKPINIQTEFNNKIELFTTLCTRLKSLSVKTETDLTIAKENLYTLKGCVYEFLVNSLKRMKEEHACFHPNLNVFNKFKTYYRQIKEFYLYFEASLNTITSVYQWSSDVVLKNKQSNEFYELMAKMDYFNGVITELDGLVEKVDLFSYHSEISITKYQGIKQEPSSSCPNSVDEDQDYEYEYDNNNNNLTTSNRQQRTNLKNECFNYDYERIDETSNNDYSDYCQIDEESEASYDFVQTVPVKQKPALPAPLTLPLCMTLKKNEEKIKREIKIATSNNQASTDSTRITIADQMLLKFYLKHIEDNLLELNSIYESLMNKLVINESIEEDLKEDGSGHKLAINGHKLVFICDTLERNLNNTYLKTALNESSMNLCESLKLYMIRIKTTSLNNGQHGGSRQKLIIDSLKSVLGASNKFKQVIIKYYFKSY